MGAMVSVLLSPYQKTVVLFGALAQAGLIDRVRHPRQKAQYPQLHSEGTFGFLHKEDNGAPS